MISEARSDRVGIVGELSKVPVLKDDQDAVRRMATRLIKKIVAKGQVLIAQGQLGSEMFILVKGKVQATVDGEKVQVFEGTCRFGQRTMLRQDEAAGATCTVLSDECVVYVVTGDAFIEACRPSLCALKMSKGTTLYGKKGKGNVGVFMGVRYGVANRFEQAELAELTQSPSTVLRVVGGPCCPHVEPAVSDTSFLGGALSGPKSIPSDLLFLPTDEMRNGTLVGTDGLPQTDDCLQLNVFTPLTRGSKLPVMVFIHGGAFVHGSSTNPMYNGCEIASKGGVIVVTINYRLAALGFLVAQGVTPNLGLLDQLTALRWVQKHIDSFGGDRDNVTVFGESAGAMSIGCLMGSPYRTENPSGRTLFHKAILQSGAALNAHAVRQAEETSRIFASHLGIDYDTGELTCERLQREFSIRDILRAGEGVGMNSLLREDLRGKAMAFEPAVVPGDVVFSMVHPAVAIERGIAKDVVTMIGTTKHEYRLFLFAGQGGVKSLVRKSKLSKDSMMKLLSNRVESILNDPDRWDHVENAASRSAKIVDYEIKACGVKGPKISKADISAVVDRVYSTWFFELPCLRFAETQAKYNSVYVYRIDFESLIPGLGACHAIDLPLVFGTWKHSILRFFTGVGDRTKQVSNSIQSSWYTFARTGDPNTHRIRSRVGSWPKFEPGAAKALVFATDNGTKESVQTFPDSTGLSSWDGICVSRL
uniref:Cyclic nucleotide-binding domain-containing protein n=1 Tax=Mucochytrium quahogii TaxID=96639 RepID=A0A7S2W4T0_9STRA|mmetsp:Transcript_17288/g.29599  ORF Transcript_17288/g.29599 Transcript_17288/m.29599 type:complete len:704 (-) Transcript_17288:3722-5833(-)